MEIILVALTVLAAIAFAKSVWSYSRELADRIVELDEIERDCTRHQATIAAMNARRG